MGRSSSDIYILAIRRLEPDRAYTIRDLTLISFPDNHLLQSRFKDALRKRMKNVAPVNSRLNGYDHVIKRTAADQKRAPVYKTDGAYLFLGRQVKQTWELDPHEWLDPPDDPPLTPIHQEPTPEEAEAPVETPDVHDETPSPRPASPRNRLFKRPFAGLIAACLMLAATALAVTRSDTYTHIMLVLNANGPGAAARMLVNLDYRDDEKLMRVAAWVHFKNSDYAKAKPLYEHLTRSVDDAQRAHGHLILGEIAINYKTNLKQAGFHLDLASGYYKKADLDDQGRVNLTKAKVLRRLGNPQKALLLAESADDSNDKSKVLANIQIELGNWDQVAIHANNMLDWDVSVERAQAHSLIAFSHLMGWGDLENAIYHASQADNLLKNAGDRTKTVNNKINWMLIAAQQGDMEKAERLMRVINNDGNLLGDPLITLRLSEAWKHTAVMSQ